MVQLFGQSSFAQRPIARRSSVVNVNALLHHDNELQLLTPLGCGLQTGKGTIQNIASAGPADIVMILCLGAPWAWELSWYVFIPQILLIQNLGK